MDTWGRKHLARWLADELPLDALNDSDVEERMIEVYWELLDETVQEFRYLQQPVLGKEEL